jgi:hypothetical protein
LLDLHLCGVAGHPEIKMVKGQGKKEARE